jgi:hypothetical protein
VVEKQLRIDGSADTPSNKPALERNRDGTLPAKHLKAIRWYMLSRSLMATATNAWPIYRFKNKDGSVVTANLADMISEYEEFKRTTHGKRQSAA